MSEEEADIHLDLNIPDDARRFIEEALPQCFDGARPSYVVLEDGTEVDLDNLTDDQAVQYAWELLPIFQAAFPDNVAVELEH